MKYESKRTEKGNIGVSWKSQEEADRQAMEMDNNNNFNCYDCSYCSRCSRCSRCSYCSDCSGVLIWKGGRVSDLIGLNGLYWPVTISGTHIQIGCQNHSIDRWEEFTDHQIEAMDKHALEFWKTNKSIIMALAKRGKK